MLVDESSSTIDAPSIYTYISHKVRSQLHKSKVAKKTPQAEKKRVVPAKERKKNSKRTQKKQQKRWVYRQKTTRGNFSTIIIPESTPTRTPWPTSPSVFIQRTAFLPSNQQQDPPRSLTILQVASASLLSFLYVTCLCMIQMNW